MIMQMVLMGLVICQRGACDILVGTGGNLGYLVINRMCP